MSEFHYLLITKIDAVLAVICTNNKGLLCHLLYHKFLSVYHFQVTPINDYR